MFVENSALDVKCIITKDVKCIISKYEKCFSILIFRDNRYRACTGRASMARYFQDENFWEINLVVLTVE